MRTFVVTLTIIFFLAFFRLAFFFLSPTIPKPPTSPKSSFVRLNKPTNFIDRTIKTVYSEPQASLLSGILVGTKAQMPKDFYNALQKTGTLHIIALSGTNITMLISFFDLLFKPLGKRRASFLSIFAIIIFILFVGPSASVVRAGIMGSLNLIAILFGRRNIPLLSLTMAAIVMVIISPRIIADIGFQLSFLASLGIIFFGNHHLSLRGAKLDLATKQSQQSRLPRPLRGLAMAMMGELKLTLSAQLFTIPIILLNFHSLSLVAPLTNVLVGWTIPYLMSGGFIVVLISLITPITQISQILSWFLLPFLNWFVWAIETTGAVNFASVNF